MGVFPDLVQLCFDSRLEEHPQHGPLEQAGVV